MRRSALSDASTLQIHYLLSLGAEINQRDDKGFTPLHRAAYLAQYDGYMEIYEYLLVQHPSGLNLQLWAINLLRLSFDI